MLFSVNQRWAIGAITLATLIACSPPAEQTAATGTPPPVETTVEPAIAPPGVVPMPAPAAGDPGYWGAWAETTDECTEAAKTFLFSGEVVNLTPQKRNCAVKSMKEEHPTGRSAIYTISAICISDPPAAASGEDMIKLNFGASDTVMQLDVNSDPPLRLERCPVLGTP